MCSVGTEYLPGKQASGAFTVVDDPERPTAGVTYPLLISTDGTAILFSYQFDPPKQTGTVQVSISTELVVNADGSALLQVTDKNSPDAPFTLEGVADLNSEVVTFESCKAGPFPYQATGLIRYSNQTPAGEVTCTMTDGNGFGTLIGQPS